MNRTANQTTTNEFTTTITDDTELGIAMLMAEAEDGTYEPVSTVSSLPEARDMARGDFARRLASLNNGGSPLCPSSYKVWARGIGGAFRIACEITDF